MLCKGGKDREVKGVTGYRNCRSASKGLDLPKIDGFTTRKNEIWGVGKVSPLASSDPERDRVIPSERAGGCLRAWGGA